MCFVGIQSNPTLTQNFVFVGNLNTFDKIWDTVFTLNIHTTLSVYFSLTACCPFYYLWMCVKLLSGWQTVKVLIRCRDLRRLIWIYIVCSSLHVRIRRVHVNMVIRPTRTRRPPPPLRNQTVDTSHNGQQYLFIVSERKQIVSIVVTMAWQDFIQSAVVLLVCAIVCVCGHKTTRVIDLTHAHNTDTIYWPGNPEYNFTILFRGKSSSGSWYVYVLHWSRVTGKPTWVYMGNVLKCHTP